MVAVITGKDELSLKIIKDLHIGRKVKDIPDLFGVSLDQAKRLSRYVNILKQMEQYLSIGAQNKVKELGLKVLYLYPLFKNQDWAGLEEILASTFEETTVDELKTMIPALEEKRQRVQEFQEEVNRKLESLERKEKQRIKTEEKLSDLKKEVDKTLKKFKKYAKKTREFLAEHIGIYEGNYCLTKRVDSQWNKTLKKNSIVVYDEIEYVHIIPDLDVFAAEFERRSKRGRTEWDWDVEEKRYENSYYGIPTSEYYQKGTGLVPQSIKEQMQEIENQLKENQKEKEHIQDEIKQLKKSSMKTFFEAVERSNTLSSRELKLHGTLQDQAAKWFYSQGYAVATEVVLPGGRRADVIGFNEHQHIVIVEAKASKGDFLSDKKWKDYLDSCDEFYFCIDRYSMTRWTNEQRYMKTYEEKTDAGLLELDGRKMEKVAVSLLNHQAKNREEIIFTIVRSLSKKLMFGY